MLKKALITGATSGIGEALAHLLADRKMALCLSGRDKGKLETLKKELSQKVPVDIVAADLKDKKDRELLISKIQEGRIDLVINNAGFGLYGDVADQEVKPLLEMLEVNAAALLEIAQGAVKSFIANDLKGTVMNVSSVAGFYAMPGHAVYAASKAFVNSFSQAMDAELRDKGIRILTSCPGKVATAFSKRASEGGGKKANDQMVMTASFAANQIWKQIAQGQSLRVFDWRYQLATGLSLLIPTSISSSIIARYR